MKFAFRVDATPELGSGHLIRSLTLADELRSLGHVAHFLSRRLPASLHDTVVAHGHSVAMLPEIDSWSAPLHVEWTIGAQERDAVASKYLALDADWVICDHYGLGAAWEHALRHAGPRVMAIDDLGRVHNCDLLLDQNYYAQPAAHYPGVPATTMLLGPGYALLRPEFAQARAGVAPREGPVQRILLCMGGMDAGNTTSMALDAIERAGLATTALDVVIGAAHPAQNAIASRCVANHLWRLHVQTDDMANLLAAADLAIGAGGTATWERCALGVPTLAVELASNQRELLREGARAGFLYAFDDPLSVNAIATHLKALVANSGLRRHLSVTALALTDGRGARRVAAALNAGGIAIRRAEPRDCADVYSWRNALEVRSASHDSTELSFVSHQAWFTRRLADPDCWLLIGERDGEAVGVVRFDRTAPDMAKVSIYLVPGVMGGGTGGPLLYAAENWLMAAAPDVVCVTAVVRAGNDTSERLFARCGYVRTSVSYTKRIGS
jgi:UDP-2,4-diacetamido-2,4,6-trideoxy-beta-L-altropyranose hydrolase